MGGNPISLDFSIREAGGRFAGGGNVLSREFVKKAMGSQYGATLHRQLLKLGDRLISSTGGIRKHLFRSENTDFGRAMISWLKSKGWGIYHMV